MAIEWSLVLFTIIAGAGAGVLAFAGAGEFLGASKKARFISVILSLVLLVAGGCVSLLHLGNPSNFMQAATNLLSFSPISLELIFLGLCVIVGVVYLIVVNRGGTVSKVFAICAIVAGALFAYFSGHGYEIIDVRPAWGTPALTFSYLLGTLTIGGFLFLSIQVALKDEAASIKKIALIVLAAAVLQTILYVVYGMIAPIGDENTMLFWGGAVAVGGALSLILGLIIWLKNNLGALAYLGLITAVVGAIALRAVMWLAGSAYLPSFFEIAEYNRSLYPF